VILAVGEPPEAEIPGDINDLALYQAQQELYLMLANASVRSPRRCAARIITNGSAYASVDHRGRQSSR